MAVQSGAIRIGETAAELPHCIHAVAARQLRLRPRAVTSVKLIDFIRPQVASDNWSSGISVLNPLPAASCGKMLRHKLAESVRGKVAPAQVMQLRQ